MDSDFNPYREWLGLEHTRQPNHYELLGIPCAEQDQNKIVQAAERAISRVRSFRPGRRASAWARLLDELREAKRVLTDSDLRAAYDAQLQETAESSGRHNPAAAGEDREKNKTETAAAPDYDPRYPPGMGRGGVSGPSGEPSKPPEAADSSSEPADRDAPRFTHLPDLRPAPRDSAAAPSPAATTLQPPPGVAATLDPMAPFDPSLLETPSAQQTEVDDSGHGPNFAALQSAAQLLPPSTETSGRSTRGEPAESSPVPAGNGLPGISPAAGPLSIPAAESTRSLPTSTAGKITSRTQQNRHLFIALAVAVILFTSSGLYIYRNLGSETVQVGSQPHAGSTASNQQDGLPRTDTTESAGPAAPTGDRIGEPPRDTMSRDAPASYIQDSGTDASDTSDRPMDETQLPESSGVLADPSTLGGLAFGMGNADNDPSEARSTGAATGESTGASIAADMESPAYQIDAPTAEQVQALATELRAARVALSEMNFADADRHLQQARSLATPAEHQAKVDRLQTLARHVERFHEVLVETVLGLDAGVVVPISASNHVAIVEKSRQHLVIRVAGTNRRYSLDALPLGLAVALADLGLDQSDPMSRVFKGAYVVVHKQASADNLERARTWWQEAEAGGVDLDDLFEVIEDDYERL